MLTLLINKRWLRVLTVFTVATFLPSAAGAWNFIPPLQVEADHAANNPWADLPWKTSEELAATDYTRLPWSAEGTATPEIRPPFRLAQAEASQDSAQALDLAKSESDSTLAPQTAAPSAAEGYEPIQLAKAMPKLPNARSILDRVAADVKPPESGVPEERVKVAQLIPMSPWDLGATTAGSEASNEIASANDLFLSGNYPTAGLAYLTVMDRHPSSMEALAADRGLVSLVSGTLDGVIPYSAMDNFTAQLPAWKNLGVEAKYGLVSLYNQGVEIAAERGDSRGINYYLPSALNTVRAFCREHPNHPFIQSAIDYWHDTAKVAGPDEVAALIAELEQIADLTAPGGGRFVGEFHKVSVLDILCQHYADAERNFSASKHFSGIIAGTVNSPVFLKIFDDPSVYAWVKGWYGLVAGGAFWQLGMYEDALKWYRFGAAHAPGDGITRHQLEFFAAKAAAVVGGDDYSSGIAAFDNFLKAYPNTSLQDKALQEMGGLYLHAGDWANALEFFKRVVRNHPDGEAARVCQAEIDFIGEHLSGSVWVAKTSPRGDQSVERAQLAQMCGPYALRSWLASRGEEASLESLAGIASTDAEGTTLQGLIEAARAHNLVLVGLEEILIEGIQTPCIAYIHDKHFVFVESATGSSIVYDDVGKGRVEESPAEFARSWSGVVLVEDRDTRYASRITNASLSSIKGGTVKEHGGTITDDPFECDNDYPPGQSVGTSGGGGPTCDPADNDFNSPTSGISTNSPGVNVTIDGFQSRMMVSETDLFIEGLGSTAAVFRRTYVNNFGFEKSYYTTLGNGWTSNADTESGFPGASYPGQVMKTTTLSYTPGDTWIYWSDVTSIRRARGGTRTDSRWDEGYDELCTPGSVSFTHGNTYSYTEGGVTYEYEATSPVGSGSIACTYPLPNNPFSVSATTIYRLSKVKDTTGNYLGFGYDAYGRVTQLIAPGSVGRLIELSYDTGGKITKASLKYNGTQIAKTDYEYNGSDELTKVIDTNGNEVTYEYGSDANVPSSRFMTKITDRMGNDTTFAYAFGQDAQSNWEATKITVTDAAGLITEFDRSITTDIATLTVKDGSTVLRKMVNTPVSSNLNLSAYKDYYLNTTNYERWTYQYNTKGKLTKVLTPALDTLQEFTYDSYQRLSKARRGTGPWTTFYYPSTSATYANRILGPDTLNTYIYYDSNGRITKVTHPSVAAAGTVYAYDAYGQVTRLTDPLGKYTDYAYDGLGNLTAVTDPNGNTTTFEYDEFGNVTSTTDPRSKTSGYEYDTGGCSACGSSFGQLTKVTDALGEYTTMEYDANGNLTQVTDALGVVTDYFYDAMNRLTKVQTPAPSGPYMTLAYDKQGQVTSRTDFKGTTTTYQYDHRRRLTKSIDPVDDVTVAYASDGLLDSVTDGLGHVTAYDYDGAFRLTAITDAVSKVVKYFYDSYGRMTKVGAGSTGTFDPTQYFFSASTGLMTKVRYTSGANTYDANYFYDGLARVTKITDWIDATNGLRYGYDDGGRLTSITDYDNSALTYAYDAAGNVTSMTDYHGNTTAYTYTNRNELSTLTAPGSKTWTFHYNDIGQPTYYNIPNGMTTNYTYDTLNRLTAIEHKDGTTVLDGFYYDLDAVGNITSTTHEDGSFWDYAYDGRYRLTSAVRSNPNETIEAAYSYTYDAGDNLLTKVEPFEDDFNDGNATGWTVTSGTWQASGNYLEPTHASNWNGIKQSTTDADNEVRLRYRINDTSNGSAALVVRGRYVDDNNLVQVAVRPGSVALEQIASGTPATLDTESAASTQDAWYNLRIESDGAGVTVWRWADGELETKVLETASASVTTANAVMLGADAAFAVDFDDVRILADGLSNTTTFAVNNANELTSMTDRNGSTTFGFDAWGRMTSKARGSYTAAYGYRYGQMLRSVDSDFPGEGDVTYEYGGNGKRRQSMVGGTTTQYNWSGGRRIINMEDGNGNLTRTFIGHLRGEVGGSNPAASSYVYYSNDIVYSPRVRRSESGELLSETEYAPYGGMLMQRGASSNPGYTGHMGDDADLILAPVRVYDPQLARWLSRDTRQFAPTNPYGYVGNSPVMFMDPMGWIAKGPDDYDHPEDVDVCANAWEASQMWPNPWKFKNKVRTGGDWDFKQRTPDEKYEDFGNWHYGVVCRAWGFSRARCKKEAGKNHEQRRKREGLPPLPGADRDSGKFSPPNYGDDPNDQANIDNGMDWFEEGNCDEYFRRKMWEKVPDLIGGPFGG